MAATAFVFCFVLYRSICCSFSVKKRISWRHSVGRCICISNRIYSHVADGPQKNRKLVLVDRNQHCIHSTIFCKTICLYKCLLFYPADLCVLGTGRMEKKSSQKSNHCF